MIRAIQNSSIIVCYHRNRLPKLFLNNSINNLNKESIGHIIKMLSILLDCLQFYTTLDPLSASVGIIPNSKPQNHIHECSVFKHCRILDLQLLL